MKESGTKEMTFLEHLEELRWHLIRGVIVIIVFSVLAFAFPSIVFSKVILGPSEIDFITFQWFCDFSKWIGTSFLCPEEMPFILQSRKMTGQFTMHILSSVVVGFIVSFPYFFWEVWRFVKPGLHSKEKGVARGATFFVSLLFIIGTSFGYFVVAPVSVYFFANYQIDPSIQNEFDITSYVSILTMIVLACGLIFQLPMVAYFFSRVGVLTPALMKKYRRHAIVVILIISAVITPSDPITQLAVAIPVIFLYELSIIISWRVARRLEKEHQKFMSS